MSERTKTTDAMRWMLLVAAVLVTVIGAPLFLFPDKTAFLFSWTVNPPLTAAFLGGAYLAAGVIEFRASQDTSWDSARIAVPAVWIFTTMTLIATLLHIDKFHLGADFAPFTQFVTWVWLAVYGSVPIVMGALWLLQLRQSHADGPRANPMAGWMRVALWGQAAVLLSLGIGLFLAPGDTKALWPWALSALTARAVGAWMIGIGALSAHMALEGDNQRVGHANAAVIVFCVLELLAVVRLSTDKASDGEFIIDWSNVRIWLFIAALVVMLAIAVAGWRARTRR
ncbi:hypothetical protein [Aliiroseovarius sp. PrR006]|uniref:hypothetical protein n=1 Tax=Aliiroseovarius sp. PrR006 TaxID=2706883 RepID=UPI0013D18A63|nr:hypothetical protein [Aliiroseovarius sp. PrR006]NDW53777.1 hypothetical protein [Aliiroseovarius sp. PrR006]